jgi:hypothetical protein
MLIIKKNIFVKIKNKYMNIKINFFIKNLSFFSFLFQIIIVSVKNYFLIVVSFYLINYIANKKIIFKIKKKIILTKKNTLFCLNDL